MFPMNQDFVVCEYCNSHFSNERELHIHCFFHTNEKVSNVKKYLRKMGGSFRLPKALQNGERSPRVLQMIQNEKNYEATRGIEDPLVRPVSKKVKDVCALVVEFPIKRSTFEHSDKRKHSDDVEKDEAKKTRKSEQEHAQKNELSEDLDIDFNLNNSNSFNLKSVKSFTEINEKVPDSDSASISLCLKKNQNGALKPCTGQSSTLMKSILNKKVTNLAQDKAKTLPDSKENVVPNLKTFNESSSSKGPILCSIKLSVLTRKPESSSSCVSFKSDLESKSSRKRNEKKASMPMNPTFYNVIPNNEILGFTSAAESKIQKSSSKADPKTQLKSRPVLKSVESYNSVCKYSKSNRTL